MGKIEEKRLRELAERKIEEQRKSREKTEQKRQEEEMRLKQIEEALKATEAEVAEIQKEFEEAGRRRFFALQRLEETKNVYNEEAERIEEERQNSELKMRKEVLDAVNILSAFLNPESDSGNYLETPDHIWKAIIELSEVLETQKNDSNPTSDSINKVMNDIVSAAGKKIRIRTKNSRGSQSFGKSFQVEVFPI